MVLYPKFLSHIDPVHLIVLHSLPGLDAIFRGHDVPILVVPSSPTTNINLVGRSHFRAACEWIHGVLIVGLVRVRISGGIGILLALGDVAVCLVALARPFREDGREERPHERDAGAYATNARLEHRPEE